MGLPSPSELTGGASKILRWRLSLFELSVVNHSIIEFSFSRVHKSYKKFVDSFPWVLAKKRPGQQIYSTLCVVRQSPWLTGLQGSFITWTLLRSSFTGCNPESESLSSLKLLYCISCSFDGDLYLSRVQYRFSQVDRISLVQGFGNGTSNKATAGKPFGRRRVKRWLSVCNLSDARYITAKLRMRMREKPLRYLRKYDFLMWFSNLFIVFSFRC